MTKQVVAGISGIFGAAALSAAAESTKVELKNAQGQRVGTATITANKGGDAGGFCSFYGE